MALGCSRHVAQQSKKQISKRQVFSIPLGLRSHVVHGSLNVPIEHHPTIGYMVYNGYYKVMSNIPKMGQLPTPVVWLILIHFAYIYWATACQWLISLWCLTNVSILTLREAKLHELDTLLLNVPARKLIGLLGVWWVCCGSMFQPIPVRFWVLLSERIAGLEKPRVTPLKVRFPNTWPGPAEVTQND